ncbi:type II toxin-antitoxin system RelE/ParE family toxin [Duganella sp. 3397]|uniref:type II toxin-antitoxin system RelE/ParE family toxin n=1 Tax=Duganella sp. 3397 TaxID=2817732 RepID=UPI003857C073
MSNPSGTSAKWTIRWSSPAEAAMRKTLDHIFLQDPFAAAMVKKRLTAALDVISLQPNIGTPARTKSTRRFPIPKTGHVIEYRFAGNQVVITRWARHAQVRKL